MTRTSSARLAGSTYLLYIAAGITSMLVFSNAAAGAGVPEKLASLAAHAPQVRVTILLNLLTSFTALALGVALYGITRDEDPELAMLALTCRVIEGLTGAIGVGSTVDLLWLATRTAGPTAFDSATTTALGASMLAPGAPIAAIFFAVGSTIFCYLILRGRMVPAPLAWLGLLASVLLAVALPLQLVGLLTGAFTSYAVMWMPMLVFEIAIAFWLLVKGVA